MRQLDTENADLDLTSQVAVLTHTPDVNNPCLCQGLIYFGDGAKDLDGTGGDFEISVTIGGQTLEPDPQTVAFSTATRTSVFTTAFPVPANTEVVLLVKSPNGADTDVDVTAYLYNVSLLTPANAANLALACQNYSATRGLTGTALPSVAWNGDEGLVSWLRNIPRLLGRKDVALATDLAGYIAVVNANLGSGSGAYNNQTDSQEANQAAVSGLATAAVVGALADAAADGDPTSTDTLMQYVKQLVNILVGSAGVTTFPSGAAPADAVSLAEVIRAIYEDTNSLSGADVTAAAQISGSTMTLYRGDTLSVSITGLGSLAARSKLWFTVKSRTGLPADSAAIIQILLTKPAAAGDGLQYINGAAAGTAANGTVTVDDEDNGDVTITLTPAESAKLLPRSDYVYDIQMLNTSGVVSTLLIGTFDVEEDVTSAVS